MTRGALLSVALLGCNVVARPWNHLAPADAATAAEDLPDAAPSLAQASCLPSAVIGCGLTPVPGATFAMGDSTVLMSAPAQPDIAVGDFALDTYEVSVARFRRFVRAGSPWPAGSVVRYPGGASVSIEQRTPESLGPAAPSLATDRTYCNWTSTAADREARPMNCVSWDLAQAFCAWDGGRLPTEAEWELAAAGVERRRFAWGNESPTGRACGTVITCRVEDPLLLNGRSPLGIWQLTGNVGELTADACVYFSDPQCWGGARQDPLCQARSGTVVVRGGNSGSASWNVARLCHAPTSLHQHVGFRCARSLPR